MRKFKLIEERTCPRCQGEGVVTNDWFWDEWREVSLNIRATADEYAREVHGLDKAPPQEEDCQRCGGTGVVLEHVDLTDPEVIEALRRALFSDDGRWV